MIRRIKMYLTYWWIDFSYAVEIYLTARKSTKRRYGHIWRSK